MSIILTKFCFSFFYRNGDEKDNDSIVFNAINKEEAEKSFENWLNEAGNRLKRIGIIRNSIEISKA